MFFDFILRNESYTVFKRIMIIADTHKEALVKAEKRAQELKLKLY